MAAKTLAGAVSAYGASAKAKLANIAISGAPEDQLRAPTRNAFTRLGHEIGGLPAKTVSSWSARRPSHISRHAPTSPSRRQCSGRLHGSQGAGKGADPRKFGDPHDKDQWEKLRSLPNLLYTDGNPSAFGTTANLKAASFISTATSKPRREARSADNVARAFRDFLQWKPIPPNTAEELAEVSARLCRLLRDEVIEQMALGNPALTDLAEDWRKLLFPNADDAQFADGYAQAVTFGLLSRGRGIFRSLVASSRPRRSCEIELADRGRP